MNVARRRECGQCGADIDAARYICRVCLDATAAALHAYWYRHPGPAGTEPNLLDELVTTMTRQSRMTSADNGSRATERPLPYDGRAAEAWRDDAAWLIAQSGVHHVIGDVRGRDRRGDLTAADAAGHLWRTWPRIARQPAAVEFAYQVDRRYRRALTAIDRPPAAWYAGKCVACDADLYAGEGAARVACRHCAASYDVADQRARLLAGAEDVLATAGELCRAVHLLDRPVTRSQIDNWVARGRILRRGRSPGGAHLYRVGDVLTLVAGRQ